MSKILYTAVVLDKHSHDLLLTKFKEKIPFDHPKIFAHHMTIVFGDGLPDHVSANVGDTVTLTVTHLGLSKKAMAVKVKGFWSKNEHPHVTIAVNEKEGGKPVDSNHIQNWKPITKFTISGVVTELTK